MIPRQQTEAMIADFLARGGRIRKLPEAAPTTVGDVLRYLKERKVDVEPMAPKSSGGVARYSYRGDTLDLKALVELANRHRRRQGLAPFELAGIAPARGGPAEDFDPAQIPEIETPEEVPVGELLGDSVSDPLH